MTHILRQGGGILLELEVYALITAEKDTTMDQDQIIAIVNASGVTYRLGARQKQWNQVRFFGRGTNHSLNLGYQSGDFVADFVFKGADRTASLELCMAFMTRFGGEVRKDKTVFCRMELPYFRQEELMAAIRSYWALEL